MMKSKLIPKVHMLTALLGAAVMSGCGSDSDSSPSTAWTPGEYKGANEFLGYCPRPDASRQQKQGRIAHENHFIREMMNDIYLWREDVPDVDPNSFSDPLAAFYDLLSTEQTASGDNKDQFSGILPYSTFIDRFVEGVELGIGAGLVTDHLVDGDDNPLAIHIAYVEPASPAADAGLMRGDAITAINGQPVAAATSFEQKRAVFLALNSPSNNADIRITIKPVNGDAPKDLVIRPEEVTINPVITQQVIDEGEDKLGYVLFNTFTSDLVVPQLQEAFGELSTAGANGLILDLRYNSGGSIENAQRLGYMITGEDNTQGKIFSRPAWNDRHPDFDPITGEMLVDEPFITTEPDNTTALKSLELDRVYVLTSPDTCSASELVMNALRGIDIEVVQIGQTTCGKPYGFYPIPNCEFVYFPVQFREVNAKGFGEYAEGFSAADGGAVSNTVLPGCTADDDISTPLGDREEGLLATALTYHRTGQCPQPAAGTAILSKEGGLANRISRPSSRRMFRQPWESIAIKGVEAAVNREPAK